MLLIFHFLCTLHFFDGANDQVFKVKEKIFLPRTDVWTMNCELLYVEQVLPNIFMYRTTNNLT